MDMQADLSLAHFNILMQNHSYFISVFQNGADSQSGTGNQPGLPSDQR